MSIKPYQRVIVYGKVRGYPNPLGPRQLRDEKKMEEDIHAWFRKHGVIFSQHEGITLATLPNYANLESPRGYGDHAAILTFSRPDGEDDAYYLEIEQSTDVLETEADLKASEVFEDTVPDSDIVRAPGAMTHEQAIEGALKGYPGSVDDPAFTQIEMVRRFQFVDATKIMGWYPERDGVFVLKEVRWNIVPEGARSKHFFEHKRTHIHWDLGLHRITEK